MNVRDETGQINVQTDINNMNNINKYNKMNEYESQITDGWMLDNYV